MAVAGVQTVAALALREMPSAPASTTAKMVSASPMRRTFEILIFFISLFDLCCFLQRLGRQIQNFDINHFLETAPPQAFL
jgi:hypothetical protein